MPARPLYAVLVLVALAACDDGYAVQDPVEVEADVDVAPDDPALLADASPPVPPSPPAPVACAPPVELPPLSRGRGGCLHDHEPPRDHYAPDPPPVPIDALYGEACDPCLFFGVEVSTDRHMQIAARCTFMAGLVISGDFVDLSPLSGLREVDALTIDDNPHLESLTGLGGLRAVRALRVTRNPRLRDLTGLGGLSRLASAYLQGRGLRSVDGLRALAAADQILLNDLPEFEALEAPPCLESIGSLILLDLPALERMGDFSTVGTIRSLALHRLERLHDLGDFTGVVVQALEIHRCPAVTDLAALGPLVGVERLVLGGNTALTAAPTCVDPSPVTTIRLFDNPGLTSLRGLEQLTSAAEISISGSPQLATLDGLGGLTRIERGLMLGGLGIRDLGGLASLERVGLLSIADNAALASMQGSGALRVVEGPLRVADNPALPACAVDGLLAQLDRLCPECTGNDGPLDGCR